MVKNKFKEKNIAGYILKTDIIDWFVEIGTTYEGAKSLVKSKAHFVNGVKGFMDNWFRIKTLRFREEIIQLENKLKELKEELN